MKGFSLLELMLALTVTVLIGMAGFEVFRQNEHTFETQNTVSEAQQNVRAVIFQINDEIRRAGQGVPVYAGSFDSTATEPLAAVLSGSDSTHLRIRDGYSNAQADVLTAPSSYTLNTMQTLSVSDASSFYNALNTTTPSGHFAYIWGSGASSCWSWVRALIGSIGTANNTITVTPQQMGQSCLINSTTMQLTSAATIALEEAVTIDSSAGSIWRQTAADMTIQTSPYWNASSEIARDIDGLTFTYYDVNDNVIQPTTLASRLAVVRIDTNVHSQSGFGFNMRGYPVNLRVH